VLEYFTPENKKYDNDYHKQVKAQSKKAVNSPDNREFTMEEIRSAVESMDKKNAPEEDGITGEIYEQTFETFLKFITAMYNACLRSAFFQEVEKFKADPNCQT
jgi:hypothetical protein